MQGRSEVARDRVTVLAKHDPKVRFEWICTGRRGTALSAEKLRGAVQQPCAQGAPVKRFRRVIAVAASA